MNNVHTFDGPHRAARRQREAAAAAPSRRKVEAPAEVVPLRVISRDVHESIVGRMSEEYWRIKIEQKDAQAREYTLWTILITVTILLAAALTG